MNNITMSNLLHAASTWLQRVGADESAVAVVEIAPRAAIGVWVPGQANIGMLADVDDAAREVLEACADATQLGLDKIDQAALVAAMQAVVDGARLQALVMPGVGVFAIRVVGQDKAMDLVTYGPAAPLQ
jgi:hypothetical protein